MYTQTKTLDFLARHGLDPGAIDFRAEARAFIREMELGLAGGASSLKMLPAYLSADEAAPKNTSVIALDAGGTNFRVSVVSFGGGGEPRIEYFKSHPMPGAGGAAIGKDAFFEALAGFVSPVFGASDKIGFCFSYPAEITPGRDGKFLGMTKELNITGAAGEMIGESLNGAFARLGLGGGSRKKITVLNDTAACLLGGKTAAGERARGCCLGFILGTGTNLCYSENCSSVLKTPGLAAKSGRVIVNIEMGGYDKAPRGDVDRAFDAKTAAPGAQTLEKIFAGAYQGGLVQAVIERAAEDGLFAEAPAFPRPLTTRDVCEFPGGPLGGLFANAEDRETLCSLVEAVLRRAAKLAAAYITAAVMKSGGGDKSGPALVCAEGTTFAKAAVFRKWLDYYMNKYSRNEMNIYFEFFEAENMVTIGTAVAGAM